MMFVTALVWGLGVSLGGVVGLLVFGLSQPVVEWITGNTKNSKEHLRLNRLSLALLKERNELTEDTNDRLERIADALELLMKERPHGWQERTQDTTSES